jgi:hypothetical protein
MNLQEEIANELSQQMCSEMDFEILSDILIRSCGWHKVELSKFQDNHHAIDIRSWCESKCQDEYQSRGRKFIFKDQGDAVNFTLRWL